jgi:hypothetical protein
VSLDQNADKNRDIKIGYISFEKYVTVQVFGNDSNKSKFDSREIKRRLNYCNACYHSVQNLLCSGLLFGLWLCMGVTLGL